MLRSVGILGIAALLVFLVWFVGWMFMGLGTGWFHWLFLLSIVLVLTQVTLRVGAKERQ
jgi:hypothetical protein